ncbi:MAG: hypothetical protein V2A76_04160 [Planctomycetota bacterium]
MLCSRQAARTLLSCALLLGATVAAVAQDQTKVGRDDYPAVKALLTRFDAAWSRADLDAIMEPVSPLFGCELYGKVDPVQLQTVYEDLLQQLAGSRCETHVLGLKDDGHLIQAVVCRRYTSQGRDLLEEQCHLIYLRKELATLRIVGLEEFEHEGLEAIQGNRYVSPNSMFSFEIPEQTFVVPRPRIAFALEHVLLRGEELQSEFEIFLLATARPFDLDQALDHDLEEWVRTNAPAKIEKLTRTKVAGYPARRADARFDGSECSLGGRNERVTERRLTRVYAQLDPSVLLAIDLRGLPRNRDSDQAMLKDLLQSIRIDCPEGQKYGDELSRRRGWGRLQGATFANDAAGFSLRAPPGFALELSHGGSLFSLNAIRPAPDAPLIRIDGIAMLDQSMSLDDMIEVDNAARSQVSRDSPSRISSRKRQVAGRDAVQVDRPLARSAGNQYETVVYVTTGPYLITVRVVGSLDQLRAAAEDLDRLLESITIR